MRERGLAGVEHRQQRLGQLARGPVDVVGLLRGDALAVVLEVGLQPERDVLEGIALRQQRLDVVLERSRSSA